MNFRINENYHTFSIKIILIIICFILSAFIIYVFKTTNHFYENPKEKIYFDNYEIERFNEIKSQLLLENFVLKKS